MNTTNHFIYIVLYAVVFIMATTIVLFILQLTNDRENTMVNDMHEKSSITATLDDKLDEGEVLVAGADVYADILGIVESYNTNQLSSLQVFIGTSQISSGTLKGVKLREKSSISSLKGKVNTSAQYKRIYTYNDDLSVKAVYYSRIS